MKKISLILFLSILVVFAYFTCIKAEFLIIFKASTNSAKKDENVTLTIDISKIVYDQFNLTLSSSDDVHTLTTNDITIPIIDNNEISFDIDKLSMDITSINFNYKMNNTLHEGDTVVFTLKITEISENEESNSTTEYVTISVSKEKEDNQKPTQDNNNPTNKTNNNSKTSSFTRFSKQTSTSRATTTKTVTYNGSDNNYLNSLKVKGYSFTNAFKKEKNTYFVTVKNKTTKLNISYTKSSSTSNVVITGNGGFKVGVNKVLITVNAENGESRVYRIYVIREAKNE